MCVQMHTLASVAGKQTQAVIKFLLPLAVPLYLPAGCHHIQDNHTSFYTVTPTPQYLLVHQTTHSHTLTGPTLDAPLGAGHGEDREAVVVLGTAGLDGADVAVASSAEHTWKVQSLDGLRLHLAEHGLTHRLKLTVQRVSQLKDDREGERVTLLESRHL